MVDDGVRAPDRPSCAFLLPAEEDPLLDEVFRLGESQSRYLGILTPEAWRDYARRRQILVAVNESTGQVLGYAAFRLPRNEVVLAHLTVHPEARGIGVARRLVEELSTRFEQRSGIAARCRRDFPANSMWPRLGFVALGDRPGRSFAGHLLTYWWRDHGHPDLLTWQGPLSSSLPVVIDANVFVDLHGVAPGSSAAATRSIIDAASDRIEVLVTPELRNEINRVQNATERGRLQAVADAYPRISVNVAALEGARAGLIGKLQSAPVSAQDVSDLMHVAYACAAGVPVVVTRDQAAIERLAPGAELQGVRMIAPEELVALLSELEDASPYTPAALLNTGYTVSEAGASSAIVLKSFLNMGAGEAKRDFLGRLRSLAQQRPAAHRYVYRDPNGNPVSLLGTTVADLALDVTVFRVRQFALQSSLATQVASQLRSTAAGLDLSVIRVSDPHISAVAFQALLADGFRPTASGAVALSVGRVVSLEGVAEAIDEAQAPLREDEARALDPSLRAVRELKPVSSASDVAAVERQLRPLKIADAPLPAWLVPVRPHFAAQLFGYPEELFPRSDRLGISVEHVYYRASRSGESAPSRVFWYVSGKRHGEVIAHSELVEVADDTPLDLWRRYRRLGIYTREQVLDSVDRRGRVRALRVINTELFTNVVRLARLRRLADRNGQTLQLVSASRLNAGLAADLLKEAWIARGSAV